MRVFIQDDPRIATHAKVLLDGLDISSRCYGADGRRGEAYCYCVDKMGKFYIEAISIGHTSARVAKEVLCGRVKIVLPRRLRITHWLNKILYYDFKQITHER
jgi:hypothetical protein